MGKEECHGPVELKDDEGEIEKLRDNTNTEVRSVSILTGYKTNIFNLV